MIVQVAIVILEDEETGQVAVNMDFPGFGKAKKTYPSLTSAFRETGEILIAGADND